MYFISEEENIELANALWKDLEGDVYGGIPSENLLIFLLYVVG